MGISNFVCEYLTKKMESEQCVADLLNSVCRANLKDALPPSEWQDVVREYFCNKLDSCDDNDDEQSPLALWQTMTMNLRA